MGQLKVGHTAPILSDRSPLSFLQKSLLLLPELLPLCATASVYSLLFFIFFLVLLVPAMNLKVSPSCLHHLDARGCDLYMPKVLAHRVLSTLQFPSGMDTPIVLRLLTLSGFYSATVTFSA